jgi:hypothetical protein
MANVLQLNQSQVFNGLGTLTFTVPTTGTYSAGAQVTVPEALATGDGAGSGTGLGAGAGGGDQFNFALGGDGPGEAGMGHGFGINPTHYNQPPASGSNQTSGSAVSSGVSVVVNDNGSPIFTAPALAVAQSALQFKTSFQATAGHTITVVLASSTLTDNQTSGVTSNVFIQQGY